MDAMARTHHPVGRQCRLLALAGVLATAAAFAGAEEQAASQNDALPLRVHVKADHTYLRAGPSGDFYPTARLPRGAVVEVWAIDESGFAAVRPAEGSFSWVRGRDVDIDLLQPPAEDGDNPPRRRIGVVVRDGAVARIGSQLNACRHAAQVRLEAGERVSVIEEVRVEEGRDVGLWVRIDPPAGEFRWAWIADLTLPETLLPEPADVRLTNGEMPMGPAEPGRPDVGGTAGLRPLELPAESARPMPAGPQDAPWYSRWVPQGSGVFDPWSRVVSPPVSSGATATAADELADIDLALSLAVAGPQETWNLQPLRERLAMASARSTSHQERLRADALDARLARFEAIHARRAALASAEEAPASTLRLGSLWSSLSALGSRPVRPGVLPGGAPAGGQPAWTPPDTVETTGRLATVVSRRPDAPRWALVDKQNEVLVFVAPSPGVNLAPLVGREVALRGARGYMPEYKRPYMVATEAEARLADAPPTSSDMRRR